MKTTTAFSVTFFLLSALCVADERELAVTGPVKVPSFINQRRLIVISDEKRPRFIRLGNRWVDPISETDAKGDTVDLKATRERGRDDFRLIQLDETLNAAMRGRFIDAGYEVVGCIPGNTYIVRVPDAKLKTAAEMKGVRWVGNYAARYRISDTLSRVLRSRPGEERIRVKAVFTPDVDIKSCVATARLVGNVVSWEVTQCETILEVDLPASKVETLAGLGQVIIVEYAPIDHVMNNVAGEVMDVRDMWDTRGFYGSNEIVAVADSGIDIGTTGATIHADFKDGAGNSRIVSIWDFLGDGADDAYSGHGTHVAGSVLGNGHLSGANPTNSYFPSGCYAGTAPKAKLVFQALGSNDQSVANKIYTPSNLNDLFQEAYTNGARIHQNSWGADVYGAYDAQCRQLDEFVFNNPDMLICFSAGNAGVDVDPTDGIVDLGSMGRPGTSKNCLTVGASENLRTEKTLTWGGISPTKYPIAPINPDRVANNTNGMAGFSSRGPCEDGRIKPDIVAPGTYIISTRTHALPVATNTALGWGQVSGTTNYVYMGGTSMSSPLVSGAAAVMREYLRVEKGVSNPPAVLLKAMLINGATDMAPGQYGTATQEVTSAPNNVEGWGRLNLENSLYYGGQQGVAFWNGWDAPITAPGLFTTNIAVQNASYPVRFHLTWTDFPASTLTLDSSFTDIKGGGLVNDLDMRVIGPGGETNLPLARNTSVGLYYYTNNNSFLYYAYTGMYEAERCTAAELPLSLTRIQRILYDRSGVGGQFVTYVWAGADTIGQPGAALFAQTNTLSAGSPGVKSVSIPVSLSVTTTNFYVGGQTINTNVVIPRDNNSSSTRSWYDYGGWVNDNTGDLWIHAYGTAPTNDHVNNVEGIVINSPVVGTYRVEISAANVPYPPVRYAVAVSGGLVPEPAAGFAVVSVLLAAWMRRRA